MEFIFALGWDVEINVRPTRGNDAARVMVVERSIWGGGH
jgi:hypothetical protein